MKSKLKLSNPRDGGAAKQAGPLSNPDTSSSKDSQSNNGKEEETIRKQITPVKD